MVELCPWVECMTADLCILRPEGESVSATNAKIAHTELLAFSTKRLERLVSMFMRAESAKASARLGLMEDDG